MYNTQSEINSRCVATIQILFPFAFKIERCLFIHSKHSNTTINLRERRTEQKNTHASHTNKDSISKIKSCQFGWLLLVLLSFYFNIQTAIWYRLMWKSEKQIIIESETYWISPYPFLFPFLLFVFCLFLFFSVPYRIYSTPLVFWFKSRHHNEFSYFYIFRSHTNWWTHSIVSMTFPRYSYIGFFCSAFQYMIIMFSCHRFQWGNADFFLKKRKYIFADLMFVVFDLMDAAFNSK